LVSTRRFLFSILYRLVRFLAKNIVFGYQKVLRKDKDLESIIDFGDKNLVRINKYLGAFTYHFSIPKNIGLQIFDLRFDSPLVAASFKSKKDLLDIWLKLGLGGAIFKTIMKDERHGNKRPRMQQVRLERQACIVNALGLPGKGIKSFTKEILNSPLWEYHRPLGISIGGEDLEEYVYSFNNIEESIRNKVPDNYFYEINISCPNTDTGRSLGDDLVNLEKLTDHLRKNCSNAISLKVSPDWSDVHLRNIGEIIRQKDKMFINAGNTQFRTVDSLGLKSNQLSRKGGGLSGVAIFPRTLEMIHIYKDMDINIMATGGISTIHHFQAAKDSGASLIGMATALIMDPYCIPKINYELEGS
tara:strand:+ start:922 stop:1995 length:1074 start_codon:yes stop_codon:yes gene_type:complete